MKKLIYTLFFICFVSFSTNGRQNYTQIGGSDYFKIEGNKLKIKKVIDKGKTSFGIQTKTVHRRLSFTKDFKIKDCYIYPNPTKDYIQIVSSDRSNKFVCSLYGILGNKISNNSGTLIAMNEWLKNKVSILPPSVYILEMQNTRSKKIFKFIKN